MLTTPPPRLVDRFRAFVGTQGGREVPDRMLPSFRLANRLVVFGSHPATEIEPGQIAQWIKEAGSPLLDDPDAYEVLVAVDGATWSGPVVVARGVRMLPSHDALADLVGLPAGWREATASALNRALDPVRIAGVIRTVRLRATGDGVGARDAPALIDTWLDGVTPDYEGRILYLRAEAGKGKSTLMADRALHRLVTGGGPVPLYVPLRVLQRGVGISWGEIAASVGVVGDRAQQLASAVQAGLVSLLLDGLDEVAGRYDQAIIHLGYSPRAKHCSFMGI